MARWGAGGEGNRKKTPYASRVQALSAARPDTSCFRAHKTIFHLMHGQKHYVRHRNSGVSFLGERKLTLPIFLKLRALQPFLFSFQPMLYGLAFTKGVSR